MTSGIGAETCTNPECAAMLLALESAMSDPPRAIVALTVLEAKAAEELLVRFDYVEEINSGLQSRLGSALRKLERVEKVIDWLEGDARRRGDPDNGDLIVAVSKVEIIIAEKFRRAILSGPEEEETA